MPEATSSVMELDESGEFQVVAMSDLFAAVRHLVAAVLPELPCPWIGRMAMRVNVPHIG